MATLMSGRDFRLHTSPAITIGVDVGQRVDPTTIAVAELLSGDRPQEPIFAIRSLERLPLDTPYPVVAARIAEVVVNIEALPVAANHARPTINLLIDSTGVGRPVVDLVRDALKGSTCRLTAVTFTHGERLTTVERELRLGKAFLVSRMQALFQTNRVLLPADHPEAEVMVRELQDYQIKTDPEGDSKFGAFKVGTHDDLVTAVGLAVLQDSSGRGMWTT